MTGAEWFTFTEQLSGLSQSIFRNLRIGDYQEAAKQKQVSSDAHQILLPALDRSHDSASVLHIHLVGDGKAGKSVAAKWLTDYIVKIIALVVTVQKKNFMYRSNMLSPMAAIGTQKIFASLLDSKHLPLQVLYVIKLMWSLEEQEVFKQRH